MLWKKKNKFDGTTRPKINKEGEDLNIIHHLDLIYLYGTLHPTIAEYTFFSSTHATVSGMYHILVHKTNQ